MKLLKGMFRFMVFMFHTSPPTPPHNQTEQSDRRKKNESYEMHVKLARVSYDLRVNITKLGQLIKIRKNRVKSVKNLDLYIYK